MDKKQKNKLVLELGKKVSGKRVVVAVSGGVDSSVAAYLLKEAGAKLQAVHMNHLGKLADIKKTEKLCNYLNIQLNIIDLQKKFNEIIIDKFIEAECGGETPNPCVWCNRTIKFGLLIDKVLAEIGEFDFFSTGHYVINKKGRLYRALDKKKDQTYYLNWILNSSIELSRLIFPIGKLKKDEVWKIAKSTGLPTYKSKESQDICFINDLNKFLYQKLGEETGDFVDKETGKKLGEHKGSYFYTIGQRRGIGIGGVKEPYYVVGKKGNDVFLAQGRENEYLMRKSIKVQDLNLFTDSLPNEELQGVIRYKMKPQVIEEINIFDGYTEVLFKDNVWAVTPGQFLVLYKGDMLIGGGKII